MIIQTKKQPQEESFGKPSEAICSRRQNVPSLSHPQLPLAQTLICNSFTQHLCFLWKCTTIDMRYGKLGTPSEKNGIGSQNHSEVSKHYYQNINYLNY